MLNRSRLRRWTHFPDAEISFNPDHLACRDGPRYLTMVAAPCIGMNPTALALEPPKAAALRMRRSTLPGGRILGDGQGHSPADEDGPVLMIVMGRSYSRSLSAGMNPN